MRRNPLSRTRLTALLALAWLAAGLTGLQAARPAPWATGESRAEDLVIRLVTIGPGEPIYTWWGHTALIVEDGRLGHSRFYNYGLFSFTRKNFVLNFAMGRLWFEVGAGDPAFELEGYAWENRDIRLQTLDLPPAPRLALAAALEENIRPENRTYLYDHYTDNCTTRVRDLIDRATDGRLSAAAAAPGRMTLRQHTRRFTAGHGLTEWVLMFLMAGRIDRPVTRWQEMFLPSELERNVDALTIPDESGAKRPLVRDSTGAYAAAGRRPVPQAPPPDWPAALAVGLAAAAAAALLGLWWRRGGKAARVAFGACNALLGLALGLPGTILFFLSLFTDHTVTYGNLNLSLANPLPLAAIGLGLGLAAGRERSGRWLARLWLLLVALALAGLALQAVPGLRQHNLPAVATLLPLLLSLAAVSGRRGLGSPSLTRRGGTANPA